jgi:hypothetical protein
MKFEVGDWVTERSGGLPAQVKQAREHFGEFFYFVEFEIKGIKKTANMPEYRLIKLDTK